MKVVLRKFFVLIAAILILPATVSLAVAEENNTGNSGKTEIDTAQTEGWVKFASEIAKYGKAQQDPIALISAARILKESRAKEVAPDKEAGAGASASPQPVAEVMKEWLDEARKIAQGLDKNKDEIIALADEAGRKSRGYWTRHYYYRYHPVCY